MKYFDFEKHEFIKFEAFSTTFKYLYFKEMLTILSVNKFHKQISK